MEEMKPKLKRAHSIKDLLTMKKEVIPFEGVWKDALGQPERHGIWCVLGKSTNGKSSFAMQLARELMKFGKVIYYSLEEGNALPFIDRLRRHGFTASEKRMQVLYQDQLHELGKRMEMHKSPDFYIIDSVQCFPKSTKVDYILDLKYKNPKKVLIFLSQIKRNEPKGALAEEVHYYADMKIQIIGQKAKNKGRTQGTTNEYTIWDDYANKYWEPLKQ